MDIGLSKMLRSTRVSIQAKKLSPQRIEIRLDK